MRAADDETTRARVIGEGPDGEALWDKNPWSDPPTEGEGTKEERYYTALGQACDALVRCKDCRRLITHAQIQVRGCCPSCGNRKVMEITTLSIWEWLKVRTGWIDFPYRQAFLKEFSTK